jgi:hypothetical protein
MLTILARFALQFIYLAQFATMLHLLPAHHVAQDTLFKIPHVHLAQIIALPALTPLTAQYVNHNIF